MKYADNFFIVYETAGTELPVRMFDTVKSMGEWFGKTNTQMCCCLYMVEHKKKKNLAVKSNIDGKLYNIKRFSEEKLFKGETIE